MDRRLFLGLSGAAVPALISGTSNAHEGVVSSGVVDDDRRIEVQSENGVYQEKYSSRMMQGFPPENPIRAEDLHSKDHVRRRWALQHITELCKTQTISRGSGPVTVLPRKMEDIGNIKVRSEVGPIKLHDFLRETSTDAFMVLQNGKIITEQYFGGMRPETPHLIWSCSKSISAGVVANLLEQHAGFKRDSPVTKYVPDLKKCGYEGCTVEQLLNMQSSIAYRFGQDEESVLRHKSDNQCGKHYRSAEMYPRLKDDDHAGQYEFLKSLVVDPKQKPHGKFFCYKDSDTAVLSWVCERLTKSRFVDLISEMIWSKLGAEHDASIVCGPQGACTPAAGMSVALRDFARWGQMHLQNGWWNGRQIVPAKFVENVASYRKDLAFGENSFPPKAVLLDGLTYRDQFWVNCENEGEFHALGHCGQICYIHPKSNIVIVRFASAKETEPKYNEVLQMLADVVRELT